MIISIFEMFLHHVLGTCFANPADLEGLVAVAETEELLGDEGGFEVQFVHDC
jgi:hypothetical protein